MEASSDSASAMATARHPGHLKRALRPNHRPRDSRSKSADAVAEAIEIASVGAAKVLRVHDGSPFVQIRFVLVVGANRGEDS
jgi:hypothetical protein